MRIINIFKVLKRFYLFFSFFDAHSPQFDSGNDSHCCTHKHVIETITQTSSEEKVSNEAPDISLEVSGIGKIEEIYKKGDETRPKNVKVTFLIRTF